MYTFSFLVLYNKILYYCKIEFKSDIESYPESSKVDIDGEGFSTTSIPDDLPNSFPDGLFFVVYATDYLEYCGGCLVLHRICDLLNSVFSVSSSETICYLFPFDMFALTPILTNPAYRTPILPDYFDLTNAIAISPCVFHYNWLKIERIIHYIMYFPGIVGGPPAIAYSTHNYIACFATAFCEPFDKSIYHVFDFRVVDHQLHTYRNLPKLPRLSNLSYSSWAKQKFYSSSQQRNIDHQTSVLNRTYFGPYIELKNHKRARLEAYSMIKYFHSLDPLTYRSIEAALAGAISIVIPVEGVSKEEWFEATGKTAYGVAYGEKDIPNALATLPHLLPHLKMEHMKQNKLVVSFVNDVVQYFKV